MFQLWVVQGLQQGRMFSLAFQSDALLMFFIYYWLFLFWSAFIMSDEKNNVLFHQHKKNKKQDKTKQQNRGPQSAQCRSSTGVAAQLLHKNQLHLIQTTRTG